MKPAFAHHYAWALTLLVLSTGWSSTQAAADPPARTAEPKARAPFITLAESHQERLSALVSERRKLKAGKSTLFVVHQTAKDLRDVELQMSNTPTQRVAALARYSALVTEFEEQVTDELERVMSRKWREEANADLLRAKRQLN